MISGMYNSRDGQTLPRVLHFTIARYSPALPRRGEALKFLVSIHEEGTGITWQRNVAVAADDERFLLNSTHELYRWSLSMMSDPRKALDLAARVGRRLHEIFVGDPGEKFLGAIEPTAVLLDVDETILNLPWELMGTEKGVLSQTTPFGRLVVTRAVPRPGRDPLQEDRVVRILVVANPTGDLPSAELEAAALSRLAGPHGAGVIEVKTLVGAAATRQAYREAIASGDWDILHFAGHAALEASAPERSALRFADGAIEADEVLALPWKSPPYLVFNSACESGRAVGGKRLFSRGSNHNGLASAFLAAGVAGYIGYFWPVTDQGALLFAGEFYQELFMRENVGVAMLEARRRALRGLGAAGDLTGYSAVLFGDAASQHRRDLARAV
jgi:hypothetical protein